MRRPHPLFVLTICLAVQAISLAAFTVLLIWKAFS